MCVPAVGGGPVEVDASYLLGAEKGLEVPTTTGADLED